MIIAIPLYDFPSLCSRTRVSRCVFPFLRFTLNIIERKKTFKNSIKNVSTFNFRILLCVFMIKLLHKLVNHSQILLAQSWHFPPTIHLTSSWTNFFNILFYFVHSKIVNVNLTLPNQHPVESTYTTLNHPRAHISSSPGTSIRIRKLGFEIRDTRPFDEEGGGGAEAITHARISVFIQWRIYTPIARWTARSCSWRARLPVTRVPPGGGSLRSGVWFTSERDKAALRARFVFMHGKVYTARLDPTSHYRTRARYPRLNVGLIASRAHIRETHKPLWNGSGTVWQTENSCNELPSPLSHNHLYALFWINQPAAPSIFPFPNPFPEHVCTLSSG